MTLRVVVVSAWLLSATLALTAADRWVITRAQMSGVCTIQRETSRPYLGPVLGTYDTQDAARKALAEFKKSGKCE